MFTRSITVLTILTTLILAFTVATTATKTGQIKGKIVSEETGKPIIGASVLVVGTTMGAQTDMDGRFAILRIEPGTYTLRVSHIEYSTVEITDMKVETDNSIELVIKMVRRVAELDETITVKGARDVLDITDVTSQVVVSKEKIKSPPVQSVDALLKQVAGIQPSAEGEVLIRGGRAGQVAYCVDGVPIGDPLGGQGRVRTSPPVQTVDALLEQVAGIKTTAEGEVFISGSPACTVAYIVDCVPISDPLGGRATQIPPPAHGGTAVVNGEPYDAMFFKHHGVNPFVDTEDDHLSTFAIDVDDASFIMTRSYLERGHLPPEEAIRAEEFINHFDYGYTAPRNNAFSIEVEGAQSRFGGENVKLLRIGIRGQEIAPENRKPANLVFVVDVSGSMSREDRLGLVKKSLLFLVDELTPDDKVGIVIYGSCGRVLLQPTSIRQRNRIIRAIGELRSGGSTNAEEGIRLGYQMALRAYEPGKINRIILCSDGVANVGRTSPDDILKQVKQYVDRGITLSSIGFGMGNYNDVLLEKLGNKGNGHYAYVDDLDEARRVFVDNLTGNLQVIARDVKIQVDFDPQSVRSYRLIGYENRDVADNKFRDDKEDGGEIGSGHSVTALYELKLHNGVNLWNVGTVFVRFKDPVTNHVTEVKRPILMAVLRQPFERAGRGLQLATAAAEFAEILRGSYWAKESNLVDVLALATRVYVESGDPDVLELVTLISMAERHQEELAQE
ncbi:MAG: hypothetical protein DRP45_02935 [Candidatus Zixiibacteriota bacterium]|nr:MAG: hypothetical protein DRP45_02935 [candidate division Zixibacteria bacterium]